MVGLLVDISTFLVILEATTLAMAALQDRLAPELLVVYLD